MCRLANFQLTLRGENKERNFIFIDLIFFIRPTISKYFPPQREGLSIWLKNQKTVGLGILNPLAVKIEITFQESDGQGPGCCPGLPHFQLGVE